MKPSTANRYDAIYREFRWHVPVQFNIAEECCARWARDTPQAVAILSEDASGGVTAFTYAQLQAKANRLSNALARLGVVRGDRVAIVMPQRFETAAAAWPMSTKCLSH